MEPVECKRFTHVYPNDESNKGQDVRSRAVDCHRQLLCWHMLEDCQSNNLKHELGAGVGGGSWDTASSSLRRLSDMNSFCHARA